MPALNQQIRERVGREHLDQIIAEAKAHNAEHHPVNNLGILDCARCGRLPYWCNCQH